MKILKIVGSIILVLLLLLIALPFVFKGRIAEEVQKLMDEKLNASVSVNDIDLSLISTFPDFGLEIKEIGVTGQGAFEGIKLAEIGLIETKLDLMSVISGDQIQINRIGITDAYFHVIVNQDTLANYDIVKASDEPASEQVEEEAPEVEEATDEASTFKMGVKEYFLKNINVIYEDKPGEMYAEVIELNHQGKGDMTLDVFNFDTQTNIKELTVKMGAIKYLNKADLNVKLNIGVDMPNSKYTFNENHIGVNDLMLHFDGFVALPDSNTTELDLTFNTEKSTFKSLLSLVPAVYLKDFESVKTSGNLALSGMAKGKLVGDQLPAFNLDLKVDNGMFQYPDLPKTAHDINIDLNVKNPGGSDDNTDINLRKFHVELAENPIDLRAHVSTPVSDANIDANLNAHIDLATLNDVLPTESGEEYKGKIDADVTLKGRVSTLEKEDYENFDAKGAIILEGITYRDSSLTYAVELNKADFEFSPKSIELAEFDCKLGNSDIQGNGLVSNYLPYYFDEETISGNLNLTSNFLDLNELSGTDTTETAEETTTGNAEETESSTESSEEESGVTLVPGNIDFEMNTNFKKVLYDNINMTDMIGKVTVREQKVSMDNLAMKMLQGDLNMNGYYETTDPKAPTANFALDVNNFDIPETYHTFNTVEKMAPIGENALGKFSTDMKLICTLDNNMEPIEESITGGGNFNTKEVQIKESDALNQMADMLKNNKLRDPKFEDVNITYEFKDGRVHVKPFDLKMGDYKANIAGSNGFDYTLDYLVKTKIPTKDLGDANKAMQGLLGEFNKAVGSDLSMGDNIDVKIRITGTADNPKLMPDFGSGSGSKTKKEAAKDMAKEEINKAKKQVADSLAQLRKLAEDSARKEIERLKKEAEDSIRREAERAAKREAEKLGKQAGDELKKLFKR